MEEIFLCRECNEECIDGGHPLPFMKKSICCMCWIVPEDFYCKLCANRLKNKRNT